MTKEIIKIANAENDNTKIMYSQSVIDDFQTEIKQLQKENDELLKIANAGGALLVAEKAKNEKYKQALEEIRTLQIKALDVKTTPVQSFDNLYKVIDIVNEVLNEG